MSETPMAGSGVGKIYTQRKFFLAVLFSIAGIIALFIDKIGGGEFVALCSAVLALYGASNVFEKRNI
jgi:hypothetical protein